MSKEEKIIIKHYYKTLLENIIIKHYYKTLLENTIRKHYNITSVGQDFRTIIELDVSMFYIQLTSKFSYFRKMPYKNSDRI